MNWKKRVILYDFEVFKHDWTIVLSMPSGQRFRFHNNPLGLQEFMHEFVDTHIFVGYNSKGYDQYIMRAIVADGMEPQQVKKLNDYIIAEGQQGWTWGQFKKRWNMMQCDLFLDVKQRKGLKTLEFNMGRPIEECSVPFDIDRRLTQEELREVFRYNAEDVDATGAVFHERIDYLEVKATLAEMAGIPIHKALNMTNGNLVAEVLDVRPGDFSADAFDYEFPEALDLKYIPYNVQNYFLHKLKPTGDEEYDARAMPMLTFKLAGVDHNIGLGGIHGAIKKYHAYSDGEWVIFGDDADSFYPATALLFGFFSRAMNVEKYRKIRDERVILKRKAEQAYKDGDYGEARRCTVLSNAYKLVLNTAYGISLANFSKAFDIRAGRSICITGQCFLIELVNMLLEKVPSFQLIQSNTDGIIYRVRRNELDLVEEVRQHWMKKSGYGLSRDELTSIHQRDVNNYVAVHKNGKVKACGGAVGQWEGGNWENCNLAILDKAIVNKFVNNIEIADTIKAEGDIRLFQMLGKHGSSYVGMVQMERKTIKDIEEVKRYVHGEESIIKKGTRYNRVYAIPGKGPQLFKHKIIDPTWVDGVPHKVTESGKNKGKLTPIKAELIDGKLHSFAVIANCPDNIWIDNKATLHDVEQLDLDFYIKLAEKRYKEFF